jgi:hypothetical protein
MISKLMDLYEQEHGLSHDPETGEIILPDNYQFNGNKEDHHNPYL